MASKPHKDIYTEQAARGAEKEAQKAEQRGDLEDAQAWQRTADDFRSR